MAKRMLCSVQQSTHQGFTLPELLICMAIVALLVGSGTQALSYYQQARQLEESARQLLLYLLRVQAWSNSHNRSVLFWQGTYSEQNSMPYKKCLGYGKPVLCHLADSRQYHIPYPEVHLVSFPQKSLGFYGVRHTAQAGHISLMNRTGILRLILSTRGRLRICSEQGRWHAVAAC